MAVAPAGLSKVGLDGVKLSPTDDNPVWRSGIDTDGRLVCRIADDIQIVAIDVHLDAQESPERRLSPGSTSERRITPQPSIVEALRWPRIFG